MTTECSSPGVGTVPCPGDLAMFARAICALLPRGWAWEAADTAGTLMNGRVKAIAALALSLHEKACALPPEFHCFSADETLKSWNADYGLPDDCDFEDLCAKVVALSGASCADYSEFAELIGYKICCEDIPTECQVGCWDCGCDQLGPNVTPRYGGCELGYMGLGECGQILVGANLGVGVHGRDDCNIAGYSEIDEVADAAEAVCDPVAACDDYQWPNYGQMIVGCYTPIDISHYTGTAHHWIVALQYPLPDIQDRSYAITGCLDVGCAELCPPSTDPAWCAIARTKPAHTTVVRRYCDENGDIVT